MNDSVSWRVAQQPENGWETRQGLAITGLNCQPKGSSPNPVGTGEGLESLRVETSSDWWVRSR